ncbi:MAG: ABC transporter ATP-binding protein [Halorientalis sp.]
MTDTGGLTVAGLTVSFGDLTVIEDVSFAVDPGTVTCLIGPNGSGKTTLLRVIAGLISPDEGSVTRPASGERPVGYLAQAPSFRSQFTVRETLDFYSDLLGEDVDTDAAIERVGLGGVTDRPVEALSGGMTHLLGIAQATIGDPGLVVLDEPSSGLDPMMSHHITDTLPRLADDGAAVIVATHDLGAVSRIADETVLVDRGHVAATGPPDALLAEAGADDLESAMAVLVDHETGEVATREPSQTAQADGRGDQS